MPSFISYQSWGGGYSPGIEEMRIGFCREEPPEVLQRLMRTHEINQYRDLYCPVYRGVVSEWRGLCIVSATEELGMRILGTLNGLEELLAMALAVESEPRTQEALQDALRISLSWHMGLRDEREMSYLHSRREKKEAHLEAQVIQFIEVARIMLGIENPTVDHLIALSQGLTPQRVVQESAETVSDTQRKKP